MQLIDTHAHLYLDKFDADQAEMIERAKASSVAEIYLPNIDLTTIESMTQLCDTYPDYLFPMMGLHPCSVTDNFEADLKHMYGLLERGDYAGIGETGIDLYWDASTEAVQRVSFQQQIEWAKEGGLPIIIHSRSALDITIEMIERSQDGNLSGIFHCFDGNAEQAERIIGTGFYIGIGGSSTYKKSTTLEAIKHVGINQVVLETDAPFLSPVPKRGKRNESSFIIHTAERMAEELEMTLSAVAERTTINAREIFAKQMKT